MTRALRIPALWMFLGPPAIRVFTHRDAMASVEGNIDVWNVIRIVWWTVCGCWAAYVLAVRREETGAFFREMGSMPAWILLWLSSLFLSVLVSPGKPFSLASSGMFVMMVLAATDLGARLYTGRVAFRDLIGVLLIFSVALTALVWIVFQIDPTSSVAVGRTYTGVTRIRGRGVGYTPLLGQIIIFSCLYFWEERPRGRTLALGALAFLGLYFIYLGQTRSAYGSFGIGLGVYVWDRFDLAHNYSHLMAVAALGGAIVAGSVFLYGTSHRVTWRMNQYYKTFVLRDQFAIKNEERAMDSFATLNGRTGAAAVLIEAAASHPVGLGYLSGTRTYMAQDRVREQLETDAFHGAHNAYLETLAGSGFGGLAGLLGVIVLTVVRARRLPGKDGIYLRILLYVLLASAFFESKMAFPFRQSSVLLWLLVAAATALWARSRTGGESPVRRDGY